MLPLPLPDLLALCAGEQVLAFIPRAAVGEGDEVALATGGERAASELKPAYRGWVGRAAPEGEWTAVVVAVHPAAALDAEAGAARHVLAAAPEAGDLAVLRVYRPDREPVLSDVAFAARVRSVEEALR